MAHLVIRGVKEKYCSYEIVFLTSKNELPLDKLSTFLSGINPFF